jgi:hypothetical protein
VLRDGVEDPEASIGHGVFKHKTGLRLRADGVGSEAGEGADAEQNVTIVAKLNELR